jgi:hypothetical protein
MPFNLRKFSPIINFPFVKTTTALLFGCYILVNLFYSDKLIHRPDNVYEKSNPKAETNGIRFEDITAAAGIDFTHINKRPPGEVKRGVKTIRLLANQKQLLGPNFGEFTYEFHHDPFPSVSVVDIDGDGLMDLYFTQFQGSPNKLFINDGHGGFVEKADFYKIGDVNADSSSSQGIFYDFDHDGNVDLLLVKWGCHRFFRGQGPNKPFIEMTERLNGYCSHARSANLIDMNRDGNFAVVFANYSGTDVSDRNSVDLEGYFVGNKSGGEVNAVLKMDADGFFNRISSITFNNWRSYTHAAGVIDFNGDGWDDLLFTNDYSTDEVWINDTKGGFFEDTAKYLSPMSKHGYS